MELKTQITKKKKIPTGNYYFGFTLHSKVCADFNLLPLCNNMRYKSV